MRFTIFLLFAILPCFYGSPTNLVNDGSQLKRRIPVLPPVKTDSPIVGQPIPNSGEKQLDNQQSISADYKKQQQSGNAHLRKYQQGNIRSESSEINLKSKLDKIHGDYSRTKTGDTDVVNANYGYTKDDRQAGDKQRRLDVGENHFISRDQYNDRNLTEGSSGVQIINSPGFKEYKLTNRTRSEQDHRSASYRKYVYGKIDTISGEITTKAPRTTTDGKPTTVDDYNTNTTPDFDFTANDQPTTSSVQGTTGTTDSITDQTTDGTVTITFFTDPTQTTKSLKATKTLPDTIADQGTTVSVTDQTIDGKPIPNSGEKQLDNQQSISADYKKQQQSGNAHLRKYQQGNIRSESSEINLKNKLDKIHGDYSRTKTGDTDIVNANYGYTKDDRQAGDKQRRLDFGANHFISRDQYNDRNLTEGSSGVQIIDSPGYKEYKSTNRTRSELDHRSASYRKYVYGNKETNSGEITPKAPRTTTDGKPTTVDDYNTNTTPDFDLFTATDKPTTSNYQGTTGNDQNTEGSDESLTCDKDTSESDQGTTDSEQDTTDSDEGSESDETTTTSVTDQTTDGTVTVTYFTPTETTKPVHTTKNPNSESSSTEDKKNSRIVQESRELSIKKSSQQSYNESKSLSSKYQASGGSIISEKTESISKNSSSKKSLEIDEKKKITVENSR